MKQKELSSALFCCAGGGGGDPLLGGLEWSTSVSSSLSLSGSKASQPSCSSQLLSALVGSAAPHPAGEEPDWSGVLVNVFGIIQVISL